MPTSVVGGGGDVRAASMDVHLPIYGGAMSIKSTPEGYLVDIRPQEGANGSEGAPSPRHSGLSVGSWSPRTKKSSKSDQLTAGA